MVKWIDRILGILTLLLGTGMLVWLFILFVNDEEELIVFSMLYLGCFISLLIMTIGALCFFKTFNKKESKDE